MRKKITFLLFAVVCSISMYSGTISWGNYQWNAGASVTTSFEAGSSVYASGVTDLATDGDGTDIACWLGFSTSNSDPSGSDWKWVKISFNGDWGNNWYYQGKLIGLPAGTYYYAWRYQYQTEAYFYVGGSGVNKSFTVNAWSSNVTWSSIDTGGDYNVATITTADNYPVGAQCYASSVTNSNAITPGSTITCEFGYSSTSTDPAATSGWTWNSVPYVSGTNNWNYYGSVSGIPVGSYTGAYRFSYQGKAYVYTTTTTSFTVTETSGVESADAGSSVGLLNTYVTDGVLKIKLGDVSQGYYKLSVYDYAGRLVRTERISGNAGIYELALQSVSKGGYILQVVAPDNLKKSIKFILN